MPTGMTHFARIAFTNDIQFFPMQQTLVGKHLHKAVETPIIIYHSITNLPFPFLFRGLVLFFLDGHLPLGKIAYDHSSFSQSVRDEVGGFVQTVLLFMTFVLRYPLVYLGKMDIPAGLLLAFVTFRTDFVQLFIVVAIAFKAAYVV